MYISNLRIIEENTWSKIEADITWGESNLEKVFFAVPSTYSNELDVNCADNFLICFMLLAIKNDEDIYIQDAGVSKTLVENIYNILLPALTKMGCGSGKTKIHASFVENTDQVRGDSGATGISMGVDSFYSILKNINSNTFPINTVLYIQQLQSDGLKYYEDVQEIFHTRKTIAEGLNLKFIPMLTNSCSILDKEFVFTQYHTFCHVGAANTIRSIACYYYATGFDKKEMKLCFDDTAYYDDIISNVISHKNFKMKMSGDEVTRYEKTKLICGNEVVQNHLDVCLRLPKYEPRNFLNCSRCHKCVRTLATLEVLGEISKFDNVFDLELYSKTRNSVWGELEYRKIIMKDVFAKEIIAFANEKSLKIPIGRWFVFLLIGIKNQLMKFKRKI